MKKFLTPSILAVLVWANAPSGAFAEKPFYKGECYGEGCVQAAAAKPAPAPAPIKAVAPKPAALLPDWPTHSESWGAWQKVTIQKEGKTIEMWCHYPECQRDNGWWTSVKGFFGADTSVTTPLYKIDRKDDKIPGNPLGTVFHSHTTPYNLKVDEKTAVALGSDGVYAAKFSNESSMSAQGSGMWVLSPKATKEAEDAAAEAAKKKKGEPAGKKEEKPKTKQPAKPKDGKDAKQPEQKPAQPAPVKTAPEKPKEPVAAKPEKPKEPVAAKPEKPKDNLDAADKAAQNPDKAKEILEGATPKGDASAPTYVEGGDKGPGRGNLAVNTPRSKARSIDGKPVPGPDEGTVEKKKSGPLFGDPNFKYNAQSGFKVGLLGGLLGFIFGGPVGMLIGFGVGFGAGYALNMFYA